MAFLPFWHFGAHRRGHGLLVEAEAEEAGGVGRPGGQAGAGAEKVPLHLKAGADIGLLLMMQQLDLRTCTG